MESNGQMKELREKEKRVSRNRRKKKKKMCRKLRVWLSVGQTCDSFR